MSFTVSARVSARQFAFQHRSMLSALDQSLSLLTAGMSEVRITDAGGRVHSPAGLQALLFGPGAPERDSAPLPMAEAA